MKRTQIKRSTKPMRRVSSKMSAKLKIYGKLRKAFLEAYPMCAVYPHLPSTDIHHKLGRVGDLLLCEENWMAVSRLAHNWIHDNPNAAREKGWLK